LPGAAHWRQVATVAQRDEEQFAQQALCVNAHFVIDRLHVDCQLSLSI
jgi:hypothetical protein